MPKRIVADPENGFPGRMEDRGAWIHGTYRIAAYVYGPDERPPVGIDLATIAELRAKYWDPARQALVIRMNAGAFEFGPKLFSETTVTTVVHVRPEFSFPHTGPKPEVCSCGRLSFRHSVSFHESAGH